MGKKQHAKSNEAKGKISAARKNELKVLVEAVLVKSREKNTDDFQYFLELNGLIERIKLVESEIKVPFKSSRDNDSIDKFVGWCKDQGAKFPKIQLKKLSNYDLGLIATSSLGKDDVFMEIPESMIFSFSKIQAGLPDCPLFDGKSNVRLAFALMIEKLNPASKWRPYLDILPDKYRTVLYYSPSDMKELLGTVALSSAVKQVKFIAAQYAFLYKYLPTVENHQAIQELRKNFTYEFYCWAVSCVMTRQNLVPQGSSGNSESALIPLWDMANHSNGVINTAFNETTNQIESFCLKAFKVGDEVTMAYGSRSNEDFLIHNGFVFPENDNKSLSIKLSLSKADELYEQRLKVLELLGVQPSGLFQISPILSTELLAFMRVFNMNKDQLTTWISAENTKELLNPDLKLDEAIEGKIQMFLLMRVKILLKAFPTSLEEDRELLLKTQLQKTRMLIQYRILEKQTLMEVADRIEKSMKK